MPYSFTEKKRVRKNFGRYPSTVEQPFLLEIPRQNYERFLQQDIAPDKRGNYGLEGVFRSVFPIRSTAGNAELRYLSYNLGKPKYTPEECRGLGLTFGAPLNLMMRLVLFEKGGERIKEIKDQEVYMDDLPLMASTGAFIINGTERVVVSQLHRSPGAFFTSDHGKTQSSRKELYSVRVIPYSGTWLDFEFDSRDCIFVRIDRRRKMPATILLRALGLDSADMLNELAESAQVFLSKTKTEIAVDSDMLIGQSALFDVSVEGELLCHIGERIERSVVNRLQKANIKRFPVKRDFLVDRVLTDDLIDKETGEVMAVANQRIDSALVERMLAAQVRSFRILFARGAGRSDYISGTLRLDPTGRNREGVPVSTERGREQALTEIYCVMRPGDPVTLDAAENMFKRMFSAGGQYDFSAIGRMCFNRRLGRPEIEGPHHLERDDFVDVLRALIKVREGHDTPDDIDHLGNRRVRSVGEMAANAIRSGLQRVERNLKDSLALAESENLKPQNLINIKQVKFVLRDFLNTGQLSQFMDQHNPLSEVTHKRRVSALGLGGLTRERANFEARDVHPTHYGRICPIETPEGPNIGLINSLATYARVNDYGFLETPYRKVEKGRLTDEIQFLSAIEEAEYRIAQAKNSVDAKGNLTGSLILCRHQNEFKMLPPEEIDFTDVAPSQIVSVAASLIPFLEHNDANRALMGSNMQRQAVPTLKPEKPLVGTGVEQIIARDTGATIQAKRSGVVELVDSRMVVIRVDKKEIEVGKGGVDIYTLPKYQRTNQNTCINIRPLVKRGDVINRDDIIADGFATDLGELALGQNLRVAFMAWNGFNFEDSILISERVVQDDRFTSIHIESYTCMVRDTRLGPEELTADIPNVGDELLSKLDQNGIVFVGAHVGPGDILVGKATPKDSNQQTPEERLLRAVFGEKAFDFKDSSLRVPSGIEGTVIDVNVFNSSIEGIDDQRSKEIKEQRLAEAETLMKTHLNIVEKDYFRRIGDYLVGKIATKGKSKGGALTREELDAMEPDEWLKIKLKSAAEAKHLDRLRAMLAAERTAAGEDMEIRRRRIGEDSDLAPGVLRMVKIHIAVKRQLQPGDKMAGRHGNKGVISRIIPEEDMPFTEDGRPVDIVLNPLGVSSRMNIGQILETHVGWAAAELGKQAGQLVDAIQRGEAKSTEELRTFLDKVYNSSPGTVAEDFPSLNDDEIVEMAANLRAGVPLCTPVFDGASEEDIRDWLRLAGLPEGGQTTLYDGRTGEAFERPVTIGYMYLMKLNHLVDDKMHARSTGTYSLITQQPLGGKSHFGGQRLGEMEVWALEAYGAAYTLQEMLTVKSDDMRGRNKMFKRIIEGDLRLVSETPESFNVLVNEIKSLGIDFEQIK